MIENSIFRLGSRTVHVLIVCVASTLLIAPVLAVHPNDTARTSPSGSFTTDTIITVGGGHKIGRQVTVQLTGSALDTDGHWINTCTISDVLDTFNAANALKWTITTLAVNTPLNLTGWTPSFTVKQGLGNGSITLQVKDDGLHYQDLATHIQVQSWSVSIVDPDGIRIVSDTPEITLDDEFGVRMETDVIWQLTYLGTDLSWKGDILEQITSPLDKYRDVTPPTPQAVTGNWGDEATFETGNWGSFIDHHQTDFVPDKPGDLKYHVFANKQRFKNVENGGNLFGSTFTDYEYIDNGPTARHDEQ